MKNVIERLSTAKKINLNIVLKCLSDIANSIYFLLDHVLLLQRINAMSFSKATIDFCDKWSNLIWMMDIFIVIAHSSIDYMEVVSQRVQVKEDSSQEEKAKSKEIANKLFGFKFEILKNLIDLPVHILLFKVLIVASSLFN